MWLQSRRRGDDSHTGLEVYTPAGDLATPLAASVNTEVRNRSPIASGI